MGRVLVYAAGLALALIVACNDPTEVTVIAPVDTIVHFDTVTTVEHDTVIQIKTDTLYLPGDRIYCWLTDENKGHQDPPDFVCDDGYMGPRI